jgi:hypothetical protein
VLTELDASLSNPLVDLIEIGYVRPFIKPVIIIGDLIEAGLNGVNV